MVIRFISPGNKLIWAASLPVSIVLLLLPFVFRLDGKPHADWQQFLGRFHPLVVHLPVGLILLVPVLEIAGRVRPALLEAAMFVLSLSLLSCLLALSLGYLLAYGSGDAGAGVSRHMWGGIALTIAVLGCVLVRGAPGRRAQSLPLSAGLRPASSGWTAHQGGSFTHGDKYLTEYLPAPLKHLGGMGTVQAKAFDFPDSFYARHLYPVFDANCVVCHGEQKVKGDLRMDTYDRLMRGGSDGAVIIPGNPERSTLFERITLPVDDKKFMPSDGRPPLKPEEIAWIKAWIQQGASEEAKSLAGVNLPPLRRASAAGGRLQQKDGGNIPNREVGGGYACAGIKEPGRWSHFEHRRCRAEIRRRSTRGPDALCAVYRRGRAGAYLGDRCSFATLGKFSHLRALHLEGTAVTGAGLSESDATATVDLSEPEWDPGDAGRGCSPDLDENLLISISTTRRHSPHRGKNHEASRILHVDRRRRAGEPVAPRAHADKKSEEHPWITTAQTGNGAWTYRVVSGWGQLPAGKSFGGTHGGIATDNAGRLYVSTQSETGVLVYDLDGKLLKTIANEYPEVHSLVHAEEDNEEYFYATVQKGTPKENWLFVKMKRMAPWCRRSPHRAKRDFMRRMSGV